VQAIVNARYGSADDLKLEEVDVPTLERDHVLVRVRASSVNPLDWRIMRGEPYLARPLMGMRGPEPSVRGADVAGTVEAVGEGVTDFRPGDEVFGVGSGAFAELAVARAEKLAPKPASLTFEEAAALPIAGLAGLQALRDHGQLERGQSVLINGAAGGVGTFAVQIAKALGGNVTAVCSTRNVEAIRSLGADHVVDYTVADFTRDGTRYDLIVDNVGNRSLRALRRALTSDGTIVVVTGKGGRLVGPLGHLGAAFVLNRLVGQRLVPFMAKPNRADLLVLAELVETGKLRPVIERTYPLRDTAEAVRYVETGHARAKVVVVP
jgi:NADPH:quinone reductase-like Zn-dependent oxidoreductase